MAISELNLFPNGTSSLTADKLREQLTSQFQPPYCTQTAYRLFSV